MFRMSHILFRSKTPRTGALQREEKQHFGQRDYIRMVQKRRRIEAVTLKLKYIRVNTSLPTSQINVIRIFLSFAIICLGSYFTMLKLQDLLSRCIHRIRFQEKV